MGTAPVGSTSSANTWLSVRNNGYYVVRIDHLWMMTSLTKLQLGNNIIERIEGLDTLVNLQHLDLSFNRIKVIDNLQNLTKIEILTLFQNSITKVENLECLKNLEIFSIGNNNIEDESCVLYMRQFKNLRSLNMAGNPCAHQGFREYVAAFIPQLVYYEYRLLTEDEVKMSRSKYMSELSVLEREEAQREGEECQRRQRQVTEELHAQAFVEELDGDQLSERMIQCDRALLLISEEADEIYNSFKDQARSVTTEIFRLGQEQLKLRQEELDQFENCVKQAKLGSQKKSQRIVEEFTATKNKMFGRVQELMLSAKDRESDKAAIAVNIGAMITEFNDLCQRTWKSLMAIELVLFEQMEELNEEFEKNLGEMVCQFVEEAQVHFTLIREHERLMSEVMTDLALRLYTHHAARSDDITLLAPLLQQLMKDKESLTTALAASHDTHLRVINDREDQLITRVRDWHRTLCHHLQAEEISRNRTTVLEINHFLDIQKEEFDLFHIDLRDEDEILLQDDALAISTPRSGSLIQ